MLEFQALEAPFGAELRGVNLADALDESTRRLLCDALYTKQLLVVRGASLLPDQLVRFGSYFGNPHPHVLGYRNLPERPEILQLSNIFENGKPVHAYGGSSCWHTDQSYDAEPASVTILCCLRAPAVGGETHIADMYSAYDSLAPDMKQRIEALSVGHLYGDRDDARAPSRFGRFRSEPTTNLPWVFHPLVRRHPVTGRKALYSVAGSARQIVGMPDEEAIQLLTELTAYATQPRFVYSHRYGVGDVMLWDNASTLHAAAEIAPATHASETRLMYRVSVKGYSVMMPSEMPQSPEPRGSVISIKETRDG
jgi:taurine dioxygenase